MFDISLGDVGKTQEAIATMNKKNNGHFSNQSLIRTINLAARVATFAGAILAVGAGAFGAFSAMVAGGTFGAVAFPLVLGAGVFFVCREINVITRNAEECWFSDKPFRLGKRVIDKFDRDFANDQLFTLLTKDTYLFDKLPRQFD